MIFFAGVFLIPLAVAAIAYFLSKEITWKELSAQVGVQLVIAIAAALLVYISNTHDDEVWTGVVTKKQREWTSCEHSYQCNCRQSCTGSGKSQSCSTVCDTCYEHFNDYNWAVYFSTGDELNIERVDRQGTREPARFTQVVVGEPAAIEHGYTNYVKAAPDTLFRRQGLVEKHAGTLPKYPGHVYDYYRIDRLVQTEGIVHDVRAWNQDLFKLNAEVGSRYQADVAVVLTRNKPREWFFALEEQWLGGKKNDVILVVNMVGDRIEWVETMAWVTDPIFKVRLRDAVMADPKLDRARIVPIIGETIRSSYHRKPMADYEYLKSNIRPSATEWIVTLIIGIAVAVGLSLFFHREDVFGERRYRRWR